MHCTTLPSARRTAIRYPPATSSKPPAVATPGDIKLCVAPLSTRATPRVQPSPTSSSISWCDVTPPREAGGGGGNGVGSSVGQVVASALTAPGRFPTRELANPQTGLPAPHRQRQASLAPLVDAQSTSTARGPACHSANTSRHPSPNPPTAILVVLPLQGTGADPTYHRRHGVQAYLTPHPTPSECHLRHSPPQTRQSPRAHKPTKTPPRTSLAVT